MTTPLLLTYPLPVSKNYEHKFVVCFVVCRLSSDFVLYKCDLFQELLLGAVRVILATEHVVVKFVPEELEGALPVPDVA